MYLRFVLGYSSTGVRAGLVLPESFNKLQSQQDRYELSSLFLAASHISDRVVYQLPPLQSVTCSSRSGGKVRNGR